MPPPLIFLSDARYADHFPPAATAADDADFAAAIRVYFAAASFSLRRAFFILRRLYAAATPMV